jgi:hypothetical protein
MTWSHAGWSTRTLAHLRAKRLGVLGCVGIALGLSLMPAFSEKGLGEAREIAASVILLLPLVLGSGLVSEDLRSGVALLWLQKPAKALGFYSRRWIEVTVLTLVLAELLRTAMLTSQIVFSPGEAEVSFLRAAVSPLPMLLMLSVVLFVFSSWGLRHDGMTALLAVYVSAMIPASDIALAESLRWALIPLNELGAVTQLIQGRYPGVPEHPILISSAFFAVCLLLAAVGVVVTTRSPIPKELAR